MSKSVYLEKEFAKHWDQISGDDGQGYKKFVIDPVVFNLLPDLKGLSALDLGCGNGYMGKKFLQKDADATLMDISPHNLENAKKRIGKNRKATYIEHDVTKKWPVDDEKFDVIFSDMLLNEIENIDDPIKECYRTLKSKGIFLFVITHPGLDLWEHARAKFGNEEGILTKTLPYFERGFTKYILNSDSVGRDEDAHKTYYIEHYVRPVSDYISSVLNAGFSLRKFIEPEIGEDLLQEYPGFKAVTETPGSLIVMCEK